MAYYSGGGGTGGNNPPPRRPPPYPLRDTWMKSPPDYNSAPSSVQHGQPYHPHQRTPCDPDTEIYENIYDSRWRLLNQVRPQLPPTQKIQKKGQESLVCAVVSSSPYLCTREKCRLFKSCSHLWIQGVATTFGSGFSKNISQNHQRQKIRESLFT